MFLLLLCSLFPPFFHVLPLIFSFLYVPSSFFFPQVLLEYFLAFLFLFLCLLFSFFCILFSFCFAWFSLFSFSFEVVVSLSPCPLVVPFTLYPFPFPLSPFPFPLPLPLPVLPCRLFPKPGPRQSTFGLFCRRTRRFCPTRRLFTKRLFHVLVPSVARTVGSFICRHATLTTSSSSVSATRDAPRSCQQLLHKMCYSRHRFTSSLFNVELQCLTFHLRVHLRPNLPHGLQRGSKLSVARCFRSMRQSTTCSAAHVWIKTTPSFETAEHFSENVFRTAKTYHSHTN